MAGLMNPGDAPAGGALPAAPQPDPAAPAAPETEPGMEQEPDAEPATPEEEQMNEEFVARGLLLIYDKKGFPGILDMLEDDKPKDALGNTAAQIVKRIYEVGTKKGVEIPGAVVLNAAKEIYEELADVSSKFGYIDFDADPTAFDGAYYLMMDALRVMAQEAGDLDMDAINSDFAEMAKEEDKTQGGAPPPEAAAPPEAPAPEAPAPEPEPEPEPAPRTGLM